MVSRPCHQKSRPELFRSRNDNHFAQKYPAITRTIAVCRTRLSLTARRGDTTSTNFGRTDIGYGSFRRTGQEACPTADSGALEGVPETPGDNLVLTRAHHPHGDMKEALSAL